MKLLLAVVVAAVAFYGQTSHAVDGGYVGNGGDIVTCVASVENEFHGVYALDFVATYQPSYDRPLLLEDPSAAFRTFRGAKTDTLAASENAWWIPLYINLFRVAPNFANQWRDFVSMIFETNISRGLFWSDAAFGLVDLKDEELKVRVPRNCIAGNVNQPKLHQAVVREELGAVLNFAVDGTIIRKLSNDIQFSYLMFHEFLWSYSRDVASIRFFNRFMHGPDAATVAKADFHQLRTRLGIGSLMHFMGEVIVIEKDRRVSQIELSSSNSSVLKIANDSQVPIRIALKQGIGGVTILEKEIPSKYFANVDVLEGLNPFDMYTRIVVTKPASGDPYSIDVRWKLNRFSR